MAKGKHAKTVRRSPMTNVVITAFSIGAAVMDVVAAVMFVVAVASMPVNQWVWASVTLSLAIGVLWTAVIAAIAKE